MHSLEKNVIQIYAPRNCALSYCPLTPILKSVSVYNTQTHAPEGSDVAPSISMVMFSELSAVPMEASDSGVSSSDARGSNTNISYVSSSLGAQKRSKELASWFLALEPYSGFIWHVGILLFLQTLDLLREDPLLLLHGLLLLIDLRFSCCLLSSSSSGASHSVSFCFRAQRRRGDVGAALPNTNFVLLKFKRHTHTKTTAA